MKTREILILGLFIIAVCVVSLIPFSNSFSEGLETTTPGTTTISGNVTTSPVATTVNGNVTTPPVATTVNGNAFTGNVTTAPATTSPTTTLNILNMPISITSNVEFINATIYVLAQPVNQQNDKVSIYNIQSLVSPFNTQNSATLLGEMANPNNLADSRLFIQYMNWFASHCPLDSNTCTGLC
jgi:hypothetical protein